MKLLLRQVGLRSIFVTLLSGLSACAISTPFQWPGFDAKKGVTIANAGTEVIAVITHVVVDPQKDRAAFDDHTLRVANNMAGEPGLIGYSVRKELLGNEAWTVSIWVDEASISRFVSTPRHRTAMREGSSAMAAVRFRRFKVAATELPLNWDRILQVLEDGNTPASTLKDRRANANKKTNSDGNQSTKGTSDGQK